MAKIEVLERRNRIAAREDESVDSGAAQGGLRVPGPPGKDEPLDAGGLDRNSEGLGPGRVSRVVAAETGERRAARLQQPDRRVGRFGLAFVDRLEAARLQPFPDEGDASAMRGFRPQRHEAYFRPFAARPEERVG